MTKRQLTYSIPLQLTCKANSIQEFIARDAVKLMGQCLITYESLHTYPEVLSTMIIKIIVEADQCDYVHRAMKVSIIRAVSFHSPDTDVIQVTDIPVLTRNFNIEE